MHYTLLYITSGVGKKKNYLFYKGLLEEKFENLGKLTW